MARVKRDELVARNKRIIDLLDSGVKPKAVASMFGLESGTIYNINNKREDYLSQGDTGIVDKVVSKQSSLTGLTLDDLRKKYPYKVGDILQVKNESGKYIKATVKQVTEWQIFASGVDGYTHAISFQSLANGPNQIKGAKM